MVSRRTFTKLCARSVKRTASRFLSILAIVTVGCGFLAGLTATKPDMLATADGYYDDYRAYDMNIKGTWGLNNDDAVAIKELAGVKDVLMCRSTDAVMETEDGRCTVRVFATLGSESQMNGFELMEGRYPENERECLILVPNKYHSGYNVGDVFSLSEDDPDYVTVSENFKIDGITAVGTVRSPVYMSMESEMSTKGSGSISVVMYVMPECAKTDLFTDAFVILDGSAEESSFSDEYKSLSESGENAAATIGESRCDARYNEEYTAAADKIDDARREYDDARREADEKFADAERELDEAERELDENLRQIGEQEKNLAAAANMLSREQYAAMAAQIDAARKAAEEGRETLDARRAEYEAEKSDAERELVDAAEEIASAERELAELEKPEWIVTLRTDSISYSGYESNSDKIAAISKVFPVFFFLVAALVALTTMTRMVDEERGQSGTLKALGFSGGQILSYYVGYSAAASAVGSVLGCVIGFYTLPAVISGAYGMMYDLPATVLCFYPGTMVLICAVSIACTVAAALAAAVSQMRECPAALVRPRAPKAGKRIFLERIRPLWKHMGFTGKVTARNIFRYKKRLFMTVFGIAGCMALLVTAFGLRDSIHDIADKQFDELYKYNLTVYLASDEDADALTDELRERDDIFSAASVHVSAGTALAGDDSLDVNLCVPAVTGELKENIVLRRRIGGEDIPFDEHSAVLTEKLCERLGVSEGDRVTVENSDGKRADITVTGVAENYIVSYAFIAPELYEESFGETVEQNCIYASYDENAAAGDALSSALLENESVAAVSFTSTVRENFENTVKSIDYVVMVLIAAAGVLAVIVTYNLTNINICERSKELATLKVLGFFDGEAAAYIYRETAVLCLFGIAAGALLGKVLHMFVIRTAEVDAVMFGRSVSPLAFLLAAVLTLAFTLIVDVVMTPKIKKIDMVESMKSTE